MFLLPASGYDVRFELPVEFMHEGGFRVNVYACVRAWGMCVFDAHRELYFVQGLGVDLETVASPAATMPSAVRRRRKRQAVDATIVRTFNSSALHFSAVDNRLYLAVISGGASIFICPNPTAMGGCNRFEPSIRKIKFPGQGRCVCV